ncbi:MAG: TolC family protein [Gammaproteobacteria bacterium]|nr:TolC family protein [Gammaproteobacteria bacterium]
MLRLKSKLVFCLFVLLATSAVSNAADLESLLATSNDHNSENIGISLEDFFIAALEFSLDLKIAKEELNASSARKRIAIAQLMPQINANAEPSNNRSDSGDGPEIYGGKRYSAQLSQILFNWPAFAARNQAYLIEDQLEAEYYGALSRLLADVASRYFDVLLAEDSLTSMETELVAVTSQLSQIQSLFALQLAQITDLYKAQAALAAVEVQQNQLEVELAVKEGALRAISGLNVGSLNSLSATANITELSEDVEQWVEQALVENHTIRSLEFALSAAETEISERRGAYMPSASLILQQQESNTGFNNSLNPNNATNNNRDRALNVNIPLYAGGSNKAMVSEASSQRNIVENELFQAQNEVSGLVRTTYQQVKIGKVRTEAAQKLVDSTTLSTVAMQRGFELSAVTNVDVLNAIQSQSQAKRDLLQVRYEHVMNLIFLYRDSGRLTAEELLEIDSWLITLSDERISQ